MCCTWPGATLTACHTFIDPVGNAVMMDAAPSMAAVNGELFVAWKAGSTMSMGKVQTLVGERVPVNTVWQQGPFDEDQTDDTPALASAGATGGIAWKGAGNNNLNSEPSTIFDETPLLHEMGHMLGLHHEQQRPDRDLFVQVINAGDKEWETNYKIIEDDVSMLGPYDCVSLMHYAFRTGRMQARAGGCPSVGGANIPSPGDLNAFRYMYPITQVWVLDETSAEQPALSFEGGTLTLAWRGSDNESLNAAHVVLQFEDFADMTLGSEPVHGGPRLSTGGIEDKATFTDTSDLGPGLGGISLVWKGSGNEDLNFARVAPGGLLGKLGLGRPGDPELSDHSPAAVPFGPGTAIAWKGHGNDSLNLLIVDANGKAVSGKFRFVAENTETAPALTVHQGFLMIAWKGSGNNAINVASVNVAADFSIQGLGPKTTLPVGCDEDTGPAIASVKGKLVVAWKGESNDYIHFMVSFDQGASFVNLHASAERTSHAPALAQVQMNHQEGLVVAWKGAGNESISLGMVNLAGV
jgi:hypothetical protein